MSNKLDSDNASDEIKVLAFDVFGTVVDWHSSIVQEVSAMQLPVDAHEFAVAWRQGYKPAMQRVMQGGLGWTLIDDLHRMILDELLQRFHISHLTEAEKQDLNRVWHRLNPWPDTVAGLTRLKSRFIITTLSNGNISLLVDMAKHSHLPWDCVLSAESFMHYKPAAETYLGVAKTFQVQPSQVMMVATHQDDLDAARQCGLKTAYIERPLEWGDIDLKSSTRSELNTFHVKDLLALANVLAATPA